MGASHAKVLAIHVAPQRGGSVVRLDRATLVPGRGIEGDHHHARPSGDPASEVTLIDAETVSALNAETGLRIEASETRRNILTRGVDLNSLVGQRFSIGDVLLEGIEPCDPCAILGRQLATASVSAPTIVRALANCGGLRARVVEGGTIAASAEIRLDSTINQTTVPFVVHD